MRLPQFASLKTMLIVVMTALAIVPLTINGFLTYQRTASEILRRESDLVRSISEQTCLMLDRIIFERAGDAVVFAKHPGAQLDSKRLTETANDLLPVYGFYDLSVIVDAEGKILATNTIQHDGKPVDTSMLIGKSVKGEEWFENCIRGKVPPGETYISDVGADPMVAAVYRNQGISMNFASPIVDKSGKVIRVWSNRASWERMILPILHQQEQDLFENGRKSATLNLTSSAGVLIHDADPKAIFSVNLKERGLQAAQLGTEGKSGYTTEKHARTGIMQINGYSQCKGVSNVKGAHWVCLIRQNYDEVMTTALAIRDATFVVGAITMLLMLGLSYLLATSIARPIRMAAEGVRQLTLGNLASRLAIKRRDEIGQMAGSINETAQAISNALGSEQINWRELGAEWQKMLAGKIDLQRINAMLEQSPANIFFADNEQKIRFINPTAMKTLRQLERHLGVKPEQMLGQSVATFVRGSDHQRLLADSSRGSQQTNLEIGPETVSLVINSILDADRRPMGTMLSWEIVTEKIKLEKEIVEKAEQERRNSEMEKATTEELRRKVDAILEVVENVAEGDFSREVEDLGDDAIGQVGAALNRAMGSIRSTLEQVKEVANGLVTASQELSSASTEISSGAQEQASSLEETASSLEEMTATIRQNSDSAQQARQFAEGSREVAEKGGQVVSSAVEAMGEINRSSKKISDIIITIDEIAFQTNLLALNAAVEAARAGEQGRGFAVVAAEVRNLAQRSAGAAKEIKGLIQDSVRKVESGSELVNQSGNTLNEIVGSVKRVTDIVAEIASASREQSTGIDQINKAVTQMDTITQRNASQTEELSGTSQALASQAEQLLDVVSRFKLELESHAGQRNGNGKNGKSHGDHRPKAKPKMAKKVEMPKGERFKSNGHNGNGHELDRVGGFEEF